MYYYLLVIRIIFTDQATKALKEKFQFWKPKFWFQDLFEIINSLSSSLKVVDYFTGPSGYFAESDYFSTLISYKLGILQGVQQM